MTFVDKHTVFVVIVLKEVTVPLVEVKRFTATLFFQHPLSKLLLVVDTLDNCAASMHILSHVLLTHVLEVELTKELDHL